MQPTTGAVVAIQNYLYQLEKDDNFEVKLSTEVANTYIEYSNVGAGTGDGTHRQTKTHEIQ